MIPRLSAEGLLRAWEQGRRQGPIDRALTLLQLALPASSREELAALPIGERDRLLLLLRAATLGPTLRGSSRCTSCGERLEFEMHVHSLVDVPPATPLLSMTVGDLELRVRAPDSRDLAWLAEHDDVDATRALVLRCVVEARRNDDVLDTAALPEGVLDAIEERLAESDRLADLSLSLSCDSCGTSFGVPFDVAGYLWTELAADARRLIAEVHTLARSYGWREADILAMSAARRQAYLELVGGAS